MRSTGSGGQRRPPIYDVALAITSPLEVERPSPEVAREAVEAALLSRFVRVRSGSLELWVYMGPNQDHLLVTSRPPGGPRRAEEPVYCSCASFQLRFLSEEEALACKHVYGLRLVLRGLAPHLEVAVEDPAQLADIVAEVMGQGRSRTLRRLLAGASAQGP